MTEQRKESILYQLRDDRLSISEICFGHGLNHSPISPTSVRSTSETLRGISEKKKCRDTEDIAIKMPRQKAGHSQISSKTNRN